MAKQKKYWIHKKISNFEHEIGFAYIAKVNPILSSHISPSPALLLENNKILGPANSLHSIIRERGDGTYSFWRDALYFSSSDNSNPSENGRIYEIAYPVTLWAIHLLGFIGVKITRPAVPVNFYKRDIHDIDADVQYAASVGRKYIEWLPERRSDIRGKVVLEIGPGINFGSVLLLASMGAKPMVNDRFLAPWEETYHYVFYQKLRDWIKENMNGADLTALDKVLQEHDHSKEVIQCSSSPLENLRDIPDESVDIVCSTAVLEHIYDPQRAFRSLSRISKKGALGLHQVDFRDHNNFDRPLDFLLIKDEEFMKKFKQESGEHGNRWRPAEYRNLFQKNNFRVIKYISTLDINREYLLETLPRLRKVSGSRYQQHSEEDLHSVAGHFIVEKL